MALCLFAAVAKGTGSIGSFACLFVLEESNSSREYHIQTSIYTYIYIYICTSHHGDCV